MLNINGQAYLTTAEAADRIGYSVQTFHNLRTRDGDKFVRGHEFFPGRLFYREADVDEVARKRAAK
jgi:hypothetical protein